MTCFALHQSGSTLRCAKKRGRTKSRRAREGRYCHAPVRLHFDVLAQHVEPHLLAHFYVVFQGCVGWCCVNAIWPKAL